MGISHHAAAKWERHPETDVVSANTPLEGASGDCLDAEPGTTPEKLIATALAACFTAAFAAKLAEAGHSPRHLDTDGELKPSGDGKRPHIQLKLTAKVPGLEHHRFQAIAKSALNAMFKAMKRQSISLEAILVE